MRKKDILGNFVKKPDVVYSYSIRKLEGEDEAYSALITFLPGCRSLYVQDDDERFCLAGEGYRWLKYLPLDGKWCIEAHYSPSGDILGYYFDISKGNFIDERGVPCSDDIFLDLVVRPDGSIISLDADELQEALDNAEITRDDFRYAYKVHDEIIRSEWNDAAKLKSFFGKLLCDYQH